ncbi:MAG: PQQ-binding-like beta-propeller repeat protein, partial [Candidatus Parabeggiatoa sp.]|nr:PQQ-binding-like beta-propeller repeat protein [Candidatus Parabeggiatoa sp.]
MFNHDSTSRFIVLFLSVIRYLTQGIYTTVITVLATLLLLLCFGLQPSIAAEDGALDPTFAPVLRANGGINTLSIQTDGKVLIGGNFTYVNNTPRKYIARLNTDGSLDTTYTLDLSGKVDAIVLQPDGKILISEEYYLIRFNTDGTVDNTFDPGTGPDFTSSIRAIALQTDGKILIGGGFTSFNGIQRNHIARLNADGSLDTGFDPGTGADEKVYSLVVQSDGKVVIGGSFTSFNDISRNGIARLNTNGSLDTTFDPGTGTKDTNGYTGIISSLVLQSNGKILAGGGFSSINGVTQKYLARFNSDGSLDTTFTSSTNGIFKLKLQSDDKILAVQDMPAGYSYFRLNSDGSSDTSFTVGTLNDLAGSFAIQSDGKILIGGGFTDINGISHSNIARINNDGSVDTGFDAGSIEQNGSVDSLAIQTDDKVLIAGSFSSINGTPRKKLARLNIDGSLDTSFDYREQIDVEVITLQPDEKVLIGGDQTGIKRLNADGSLGLDASFESIQWWSTIETIITRPDGKILIGGWLAVDKGNFQTENYHIVQLNTNGSLDTSFTPSTSNDSFNLKLVVQTDAKVLVGGSFTTINGLSRNRIARLNADGTIDTSFNPDIDNRVESLFVQPDGDILIGGTFTNINGITRNHIARLNSDGSLDTSFDPSTNETVNSVIVQPGGKVLIGGGFSNVVNNTVVYGIARLNADGSLDTNFYPGNGTDRSVNVLALQSNENVIIGGYFTQVNGIARNSGIARLLNSTMPTVNLSVSTNTGTETDTTTITVIATASEAVNGNQTVDLGVSGTGIMASDYNLSATQISILDGITSGNATFTVQDDADSEGTEIATLTLSNPSAGIVLGTPVTQNVTLIDNDMPEPAIAINAPTVMAGDVLAGKSNHVLYRLNLAITTANAMLTGITVTTDGTYQTSDIETDSFKLRYSTNATLDAGDAVLKNIAVVAPGNNLVFDNLTQDIAKDTTGYLFVTGDIATTAISGRTININAIPLNNIIFAVGVKSGDDPQSIGGVQTIVAPPNPWPVYRYDLNRSGQSPYQGIQQPEIKWQVDVSSSCWGSGVDNSIVMDRNGNLYLGTDSSKLYAIDKQGQILWTYDTDDSVASTPAIGSDGTLYFGTYGNTFYALNPDGSEKWTFSAPSIISQSAVIGQDGTIYFGVWSDYVYALNPDGTTKWVSNQNGFDKGIVLSHDGTLYYAYSNKLRALDSAGNLKWETVLNAGSHLSGGLALSNDEQTIYIGTWSETDPSGKFYAVNVDGNIRWEYVANAISAPAVGSDGTIYFGSKDKYLYALAQDGTLKWQFDVGYEIYSPPTLASDNSIYFSSFGSKFYALNTDGTERWQLNIGRTSPIIPADNELYVVGNCGVALLYSITNTTQQQPTVQFTSVNQTVAEDIGTITITVELSTNFLQDVTVPFIVGGIAENPSDFSITMSPVIISAGSTTGTATITLVDDSLSENDENITITMGMPTNAILLGNTVHTVTITDNDVPVAQADLSISQTESTDPVFTGAALSYTLNVNNAGPDVATNVQVVDTLPSGVVFGSATGTDWTCNESSGTVTCTLANLNTGAANPITINVTAPGTAGSITNTAAVSATTADSDTSNNNASETTTISDTPASGADLSITQIDSSDPVLINSSFSYTITVNNAGPDPASDVAVSDILPSGVLFGSATGTDWTCNEAGGIVTCTLATLNTGAANPITINVTAPVTIGSLTNMATVGATTADSDIINNNATETTAISDTPTSGADLSITQTDSSDPVFTGAALSYTLNVYNAGPNPATDVQVTDTLPSGVVFGSATGTDWTCNESSGTVTCTLANLNTGAANPITINLTAPGTTGSITNTATITATTADSDTSNNNTSETTTVNVLPQADLSITQTESSDPVFTGAALSYTLTV